MGAKHTPGPWETTLGASGMTAVEADDGTIVASYVSEANARLIASAPRMFDYISARALAGDAKAITIMESINANP